MRRRNDPSLAQFRRKVLRPNALSKTTQSTVSTLTYDVLGRRRQVTYPAVARATTVALGYDRLGSLRSLVSTNPGNPVEVTHSDLLDFSHLTLTADPLGRAVTQKTDCSNGTVVYKSGACKGVVATEVNLVNRYSLLGMLTRQSHAEYGSGDSVDVMAYDGSGNMVKRDNQRFVIASGSNRMTLDSSAGTPNFNRVIAWNANGARTSEIGSSYQDRSCFAR